MERENESRRRLLETASELISRSSYGAVGVDEICRRASVHKGSFYHFFPAKSDLAAAALEDQWRRGLEEKERAFAADVPPLERLSRWCGLMRKNQSARRKASGMVLGCPNTSIGSELSTTDPAVRRKCREIAERTCAYLEAAIRDAQARGEAAPGDAAALARELYAFSTGALQQAKINDDLRALDGLESALRRLLGAKEPVRR